MSRVGPPVAGFFSWPTGSSSSSSSSSSSNRVPVDAGIEDEDDDDEDDRTSVPRLPASWGHTRVSVPKVPIPSGGHGARGAYSSSTSTLLSGAGRPLVLFEHPGDRSHDEGEQAHGGEGECGFHQSSPFLSVQQPACSPTSARPAIASSLRQEPPDRIEPFPTPPLASANAVPQRRPDHSPAPCLVRNHRRRRRFRDCRRHGRPTSRPPGRPTARQPDDAQVTERLHGPPRPALA